MYIRYYVHITHIHHKVIWVCGLILTSVYLPSLATLRAQPRRGRGKKEEGREGGKKGVFVVQPLGKEWGRRGGEKILFFLPPLSLSQQQRREAGCKSRLKECK